nr:LptF/LptG family permease [Candidatus Sarmatiella mevalonica]
MLFLYLKSFFLVSALLSLFIFFINIFDSLSKSEKLELSLAFLLLHKVPYLFQQIVPIVSFLSTLLFINNLLTSNQLLIISASGMSLFKITLIPMFANLFLGIAFLYTLNPLSSYLLSKKAQTSLNNQAVIRGKDLIFRESIGNKRYVVVASIANLNKQGFANLSVIVTDQLNHFLARIVAAEGSIHHVDDASQSDGGYENIRPTTAYLALRGVEVYGIAKNYQLSEINLPFAIPIESMYNNYKTPDEIPFWQLPNAISALECDANSASAQYKLYYFKQLLKCLAMFSGSFFTLCFISLDKRRIKNNYFLWIGIVISIIFFASLELGTVILNAMHLEAIYTVLLPIVAVISISYFKVLHFNRI